MKSIGKAEPSRPNAKTVVSTASSSNPRTARRVQIASEALARRPPWNVKLRGHVVTMLHYVEIGKGGCGVRLGFSSTKQRRARPRARPFPVEKRQTKDVKLKGHVVTMLHCVEIGKGGCGVRLGFSSAKQRRARPRARPSPVENVKLKGHVENVKLKGVALRRNRQRQVRSAAGLLQCKGDPGHAHLPLRQTKGHVVTSCTASKSAKAGAECGWASPVQSRGEPDHGHAHFPLKVIGQPNFPLRMPWAVIQI